MRSSPTLSRKLNFFVIAAFFVLFLNCRKSVQQETVVYENDFNTLDGRGIEVPNFNVLTPGNYVLGVFNRGGFTLNLQQLPSHNYLEVSFDLYIADSWDGNDNGVGGPDFWEMKVDGASYFRTTFRYRPCGGANCPGQSYPDAYPATNYPRAGSLKDLMRGSCILYPEPDGTTHYKVVKLIPHRREDFKLQILDQLKQDDVPPADRICDEAWSVDNITVKTVVVN